jgi:hypothetical protein
VDAAAVIRGRTAECARPAVEARNAIAVVATHPVSDRVAEAMMLA